MNIEKIAINGHYIWVDKDVEIKEGDWILNTEREPSIIKCIGKGSLRGWNKIIAASPEINLEGVPTYVEWLGEIETNLRILQHKTPSQVARQYFDGFVTGYQIAEKELPTWDNVRKAIELAREGMRDYTEVSESQIIEQLKQEKK